MHTWPRLDQSELWRDICLLEKKCLLPLLFPFLFLFSLLLSSFLSPNIKVLECWLRSVTIQQPKLFLSWVVSLNKATQALSTVPSQKSAQITKYNDDSLSAMFLIHKEITTRFHSIPSWSRCKNTFTAHSMHRVHVPKPLFRGASGGPAGLSSSYRWVGEVGTSPFYPIPHPKDRRTFSPSLWACMVPLYPPSQAASSSPAHQPQ